MDSRQQRTGRRGATIIEQLAILAFLGVLLAVAVATGARLLDKAAVAAAARDAIDAFASARDQAVAGGRRAAIRITAAENRLVVHVGDDTISRTLFGDTHKVFITSTRDSMAYAPTGLGWGASNLRLVFTRGAAAETVTVSRLGRTKRS